MKVASAKNLFIVLPFKKVSTQLARTLALAVSWSASPVQCRLDLKTVIHTVLMLARHN
jgi:hypothetical protein